MSTSKRHIRILLLLTAALMLLLAGCERVDGPTPQPETQDEICLNASVWQMMQGAPLRANTYNDNAPLRAHTYDAGTLTSGSFTASAYVANTTDVYISPVTVNWETDKWVWSDGKHYWPASGNLDFFAYMPATKPSYISSITYAVDGTPAPAPYFVCADFPMTTAGQNAEGEFVYALTTGQNKTTPGSSGVTMYFKRPFARVKFQLSASHPDIVIRTITFKSLKSGGTCTFNGTTSTWSSLTPTEGTVDLVGSFNDLALNTNASVQEIGELFVVPQTFAGDIVVNAGWTDWGETLYHNVSATISSITWQAGYSYTYTFTITEHDMVVNVEKFTEQW